MTWGETSTYIFINYEIRPAGLEPATFGLGTKPSVCENLPRLPKNSVLSAIKAVH